MTDFHGRFCWYELMTGDRDAAKGFYGDVVGWGVREAPVSGKPYSMFTAAEQPVGGLMELTGDCQRMGAAPGWIGYVAVGDVDRTAALAERLGGVVRVPGTDIPDIGRFAVISDPEGATIALFTAEPGCGQPTDQWTQGGVGWHELQTTDWRAAFDFYHQLFGWEKAEAMDMGEMGTYQIFAAQGTAIGGMFDKAPGVARPFWLFYFNVGDIDAAMRRSVAGGAHIINGPMAVPGEGWIIQGTDPQGVMFALHGKRGEDRDREFVIGRTIKAPRDRVFEAWTDAALLARWWGPKDFGNPVCEIDPRPGGAWRVVMRSPEGADYPVKGVYREVTRPSRLVMTDDCSEHPEEWHDQVNPSRTKGAEKPALESLSTVTFEDEGGGTRLTIRTVFETAAIRDTMIKMGMEEGWSQSLDRLEEVLTRG